MTCWSSLWPPNPRPSLLLFTLGIGLFVMLPNIKIQALASKIGQWNMHPIPHTERSSKIGVMVTMHRAAIKIIPSICGFVVLFAESNKLLKLEFMMAVLACDEIILR